MTAGWRMLPDFLLRSTGFAFELLDVLGCPDSSAGVDGLLDADATLDARIGRVQRALADESDPATGKVRRKVFKRVERHEPSGLDDNQWERLAPATVAELRDWDAGVAERAELVERLRATFAAELRERRGALREVVADPRFGEAVWLSNPQMYQIGLRGYLASTETRSDTRRAERQLVAYLERFCAKNDTSSFFGPIDYGRSGTDPGVAPVAGRITGRAAFLAHWAVAAIASAVADDTQVRPWLRPVLSATCTVQDGAELTVNGRVVAGRAAEVLRLVDGTRTVQDIAAPVVLGKLAVAGIIRLAPEVPVTVPHPSLWLHGWLAALPAACPGRQPWLDRLEPLLETERTFANAGFDTKRDLLTAAERHFVEVTGVDPRRGGGELYADRSLYYEEAVGGASPLVLDPSVTGLILERLKPVLDLYAAHALAAQREVRDEGTARLTELAADHGTSALPLTTVVSALRSVPLPDPPDDWATAVRSQLTGREGEHTVDLDPSALPQPTDLAAEPLLTSLDLMLVAESIDDVRAGRFDIVVGECHDQLLVWGWPLYFHEDPAAVHKSGEQALRDIQGNRVYGNVVPTRRVKISPFQYPGPAVVLGGVRPRPGNEVPIAAVTAGIRDGRPGLSAPGAGRVRAVQRRATDLRAPDLRPAPARSAARDRDRGAHAPAVRRRCGGAAGAVATAQG